MILNFIDRAVAAFERKCAADVAACEAVVRTNEASARGWAAAEARDRASEKESLAAERLHAHRLRIEQDLQFRDTEFKIQVDALAETLKGVCEQMAAHAPVAGERRSP